ncbi:MAG: FeoB-associated Cys-rich membrane protein [Erysipelotrichaceae bacterium]|nr:FeoB-associated Cys-rich membrane protein [Erysipelotrichaceae bacterium]MCI9524301.1 FeoB-associated Cys-rich membrane protein [Erysipelotrichaceae bacterium]
MATFFLLIILIGIVYLAIHSLLKQKNSCGGACTSCHACHKGSDLYQAYHHDHS